MGKTSAKCAKRAGLGLVLLTLGTLGFINESDARITRIEISQRTPAFEGATFGAVGAYEQLDGTAYGEIDEPPSRALTDLGPGERGTFSRVSDSNPEMLRYLDSRGIRPGAGIRITAREPFEGPISVRVGQNEHALGAPVARRMRVTTSAPRE